MCGFQKACKSAHSGRLVRPNARVRCWCKFIDSRMCVCVCVICAKQFVETLLGIYVLLQAVFKLLLHINSFLEAGCVPHQQLSAYPEETSGDEATHTHTRTHTPPTHPPTRPPARTPTHTHTRTHTHTYTETHTHDILACS